MMIVGALEWLKKNLEKRPAELVSGKRRWLYNDSSQHYAECLPTRKLHAGADVNIETIESLCRLIGEVWADRVRKIEIFIGAKGIFAHGGPDLGEELDSCVPFTAVDASIQFLRNTLPDGQMDYHEFIQLISKYEDRIEGADALRFAVSNVEAGVGEVSRISTVGAVTTIERAGTQKIEGHKVDIPRDLKVTLECGTREFTYDYRYRLHVWLPLRESKVTFSLRCAEQPTEDVAAFTVWAREAIEAELKDVKNLIVLAGSPK